MCIRCALLPDTCRRCNGSGSVPDDDSEGWIPRNKRCPDCGGTGLVGGD